MPERPESAELRSRVTAWLQDQGWNVDVRGHDLSIWLVDARRGGHLFAVAQPKETPALILIETRLGLEEQHTRAIARLKSKRKTFLYALVAQGLSRDVQVGGVSEREIRGLAFNTYIPHEGLDHQGFFAAFQRVMSAKLTAGLSVASMAGDNLPSGPAGVDLCSSAAFAPPVKLTREGQMPYYQGV